MLKFPIKFVLSETNERKTFKVMEPQTKIFLISLSHVNEIISELNLLYVKECHRESDDRLLFKIEETDKIRYHNRFNQLMTERFSDFNNIKFRLLQLNSQFHSLKETLSVNENIMAKFSKYDITEELVNPYLYIIDEEIRSVQYQLDELELPHVLIYSKGEKYKIQQLKTKQDKNDLLDHLIELLKPFDDDEPITNYEEIIDHQSVRILESLDVNLDLKISEYNSRISDRQINEYLNQYWDVKYKVKYTIPNLNDLFDEEYIENQLNYSNNVKIINHDILFTYYSDEDIDGHDIQPSDEKVDIQLRQKCKKLFLDIVGESYEHELLQRIHEIGNGDFQIELVQYSFPDRDF